MAGAATRLAVPVLGAAAVTHALPALLARGPARRLTPRLAGRGRPGGIALTFDDGPDPAREILDVVAALRPRAQAA